MLLFPHFGADIKDCQCLLLEIFGPSRFTLATLSSNSQEALVAANNRTTVEAASNLRLSPILNAIRTVAHISMAKPIIEKRWRTSTRGREPPSRLGERGVYASGHPESRYSCQHERHEAKFRCRQRRNESKQRNQQDDDVVVKPPVRPSDVRCRAPHSEWLSR
jgi:hypothetical protein